MGWLPGWEVDYGPSWSPKNMSAKFGANWLGGYVVTVVLHKKHKIGKYLPR